MHPRLTPNTVQKGRKSAVTSSMPATAGERVLRRDEQSRHHRDVCDFPRRRKERAPSPFHHVLSVM